MAFFKACRFAVINHKSGHLEECHKVLIAAFGVVIASRIVPTNANRQHGNLVAFFKTCSFEVVDPKMRPGSRVGGWWICSPSQGI